MKLIFTILLLLSTCVLEQPIFAQETTSPQQEQMPESYKEWEKTNADKEANEEVKYGALWNKTLLLLIFILVVLFAGTYYVRRFGPLKVQAGAQVGRIQLLEKKVISPKAVIYLLSIDGHKIALSETSSGIQVLKELERKSE